MKFWHGSFVWIVLGTMTGSALAQSQPQALPNTGASNSAVQPDQPVQPNVPTLQPRGAQQPAPAQAQAVPQPPFTLTKQEEEQVDALLQQWEAHNKKIKTFDCCFKRWIYDATFGKRNEKGELLPKFVELGILSYSAPDKGLYHVQFTDENGAQAPIDPMREEHWVCDGKSIFEFNHVQKQLVEHQLPPNLQGTAIADSPLPFLFGSEAKKLQQRYWIKNITPPGIQGQIFLEAWPKYQQEAANFRYAQFIINTKNNDMHPHALNLVMPNGKDHTSYQFYDVDVNARFTWFKGNPFQAPTPFNWKKIVEPAVSPEAQSPQTQAQQPSNDRR